ncbi:MAG: bifunctional UDP-N-acetylglucosamine diphosphorylase/glucosamine-1-phosphate N-acetyltransferase GlmU [Clostridia bacterium]|nr:bifunctional UDP-N-acetylglucosamine diphosphorylase/glucosamine-1-phosphate N-acetyltransferase GlmU [Clostridia bacterium]
MKQPCLSIILAAGQGTRMKSERPKVLHEVAGVSMIRRVLNVCPDGPAPVVIIGHGADAVREHVGDRARFALQAERLGTGHAVMMARDAIQAHDGPVLIMAGDMPLLTQEAVSALVSAAERTGAALLTSVLADPTGYGRILRDESGCVTGIVEQKDATPEQQAIREVNASVYCVPAQPLLQCLNELKNDNAQGEYYLTDCVALLREKGVAMEAVTADEFTCMGVNDRVQLAQAERVVRARVTEKLMRSGVTIIDPERVVIEETVCIGQDTVIEPGAVLRGATVIGPGCRILGTTRMESAVVGGHTTVESSVLLSARVGEHTTVGPFAYLRPGTVVGDHCRVGDYVELKNATIGNGTKISHLTYIGDADVGENCNFGCGTAFANYDGLKKHRSTVGNHVFVGCHSVLISPVQVGNGAYIAAGAVVNCDVEPESLCIGRTPIAVKQDWAKKRREQGNLK